MNCGPRRPGKGNDMLEIKVNGDEVRGCFDNDFNTMLEDTKRVLGAMYLGIKSRAKEEKAEEAIKIWKGCVLATVIDLENIMKIVRIPISFIDQLIRENPGQESAMYSRLKRRYEGYRRAESIHESLKG